MAVTEAMVAAAWRACPANLRDALDPAEVRRMVAAAEAERKAEPADFGNGLDHSGCVVAGRCCVATDCPAVWA